MSEELPGTPPPAPPPAAPAKKRRGFAAMDPAKVKEIARKGGQVAQAEGKAHRFTHDEAVLAGRKGGQAKQRNKASK